ncbi:MAG TPA: hypothetical protein VGS41_12555, partial [Chthonomonadales bacterium]|nr:hypothetical protein [Chthonomonadales bacterium]
MPTGATTFVLTDIERSSRMWDLWPAQMAIAVKRHEAILSEAVHTFHGIVVKDRGEGDSFFAVFSSPTDAIAAACRIQ